MVHKLLKNFVIKREMQVDMENYEDEIAWVYSPRKKIERNLWESNIDLLR